MLMQHYPGILLSGIAKVVENSTWKQFVRWGRKPPHLPLAKSKLFKVPPRPQVPEEETIEISRLRCNYNTYMKSIRVFLLDDIQSNASEEKFVDAGNLEDELVKCREINDAWNAEVSKIREQRLLSERERRLEYVPQRIERNTARERQLIANIDDLVRKEKEQEKLYITPDNIDEAIENALRAEVDHNFAIDVKGNMYHGRTGLDSKGNIQENKVEGRV